MGHVQPVEIIPEFAPVHPETLALVFIRDFPLVPFQIFLDDLFSWPIEIGFLFDFNPKTLKFQSKRGVLCTGTTARVERVHQIAMQLPPVIDSLAKPFFLSEENILLEEKFWVSARDDNVLVLEALSYLVGV